MLQSFLSDAKVFFSLIFLSIALIFLDNLSFINFPKSLIQQITIPIQFGLYKSTYEIGRQFQFITSSRKASQENRALVQQNADILSENADLRKKLAETQAQVEQQSALDSQTFTQIPARPIGVSRFLYIDKGSDHGLKLNQAVVYKNNFVGLIKEVSPKKSKVMLPSDPDAQISAFVQSQNGKAKGILNGQFGSDMLLDKVLHEERMQQKDLVYSEGTEVEIPKGLILGEVSQVLTRENEVFKQAQVKPVFDVGDLDLVFVITN